MAERGARGGGETGNYHYHMTDECAVCGRQYYRRYRQPAPVASRHAILDPWDSVAHFTSALPTDRPALHPPSPGEAEVEADEEEEAAAAQAAAARGKL